MRSKICKIGPLYCGQFTHVKLCKGHDLVSLHSEGVFCSTFSIHNELRGEGMLREEGREEVLSVGAIPDCWLTAHFSNSKRKVMASLPSTLCSGVHRAHLTPPTTSPLLSLITIRGPPPLLISWLLLIPSQEKSPDCPRSCSRRALPDSNHRSLHQTTNLSLTWRVSNFLA